MFLSGLGSAASVNYLSAGCMAALGWCLVSVCLGLLRPSRAESTCPLLLLGAECCRLSTALTTLTTLHLQMNTHPTNPHTNRCTDTQSMKEMQTVISIISMWPAYFDAGYSFYLIKLITQLGFHLEIPYL
ncbi:hypothetical protein CHARACLAT_029368 [Characodon lateralis]|uniref:Uncharacterized protein n=1 Tax=Characodon lateralis TaxID=208331 RepID=A0ABU7DYS8_9TELE|nr:hypothetical protein [Characodon lateralis]